VLVVKFGEKEVVFEPPLTTAVPDEVVYQSIVQPSGAVALNVTVPEPQRELLLALVGVAGNTCTVMLCTLLTCISHCALAGLTRCTV
jgi:hypothetical protein